MAKISGGVLQHTASISGVESAPTSATDGIEAVKLTDAVLWFFSGGTSATITFYAYDGAQAAWCAAGTASITGSEVVIQQSAGDRMLAIITTHGGGTYKRSYQYLRE
jgi:hypothetical protein